MKFFHISDLHLGIRINEISMLDDQKYILNQIILAAITEKPDGILIAGDVYDKSVPPAEAVEVFDDFLFRVSQLGISVFIISGNHDSAERIAFGGRMMQGSRLYISPVYRGKVEPIVLEDEFGRINIFLLPFIKPVHVRKYFPDEKIETYTEAVAKTISEMRLNASCRNILVAHQFVTGASICDSEEVNVGGLDNVDLSVFEQFDYVALGHIHGPQNLAENKVRYCGTPLKYSFSEASHKKSITVVEAFEKGKIRVSEIPLKGLHDMVILRGKYADLTQKSTYSGTTLQEDYIQFILTDEDDIPDANTKLRMIYHGFMTMRYDNLRTRTNSEIDAPELSREKSHLELFEELFEKQNGRRLNETESEFLRKLIEEIWEDA